MFGLAVHQFVKVKKYLVFILDKFGGRETETQHHVQLKNKKQNKKKQKESFKHTMMKFNHITGHRVLCKAKANEYCAAPRSLTRSV